MLKPLDDCEVFFFVNISKVPWVGSSPNGSNITFGFPQILGLKSNELISSDVAGTLQGDQQILDIVETDVVAGKARDVACQRIRLRCDVRELMLGRHISNDNGGGSRCQGLGAS